MADVTAKIRPSSTGPKQVSVTLPSGKAADKVTAQTDPDAKILVGKKFISQI